MLARAKKLALSISIVVLFALYALQEKTQPAADIAAVGQSVATETPRDLGFVATVAPARTFAATASATAASVAGAAPSPPTATAAVELPRRTATLQAPTKTPTPAPTATPTPESQGQYADGTYTGRSADANWGNVQVEAIIANGQISDVQFLVFPNHRSRSKSINQRAMPELTQEAIQAQSAEVDIVSGATDTSEAFIYSLGDALRQAAR